MKNLLNAQARLCLLCSLFCLALTQGFAQEPVKRDPTNTNPNNPNNPPNTQPDPMGKNVLPGDTIKPAERIKPDNTSSRVGLDTIRPTDRIGQKPAGSMGMTTQANTNTIIQGWPQTAKVAAEAMIAQYGQPSASMEDMLMWKDNGVWKKTVVTKNETQHDFPKSHKDVLEQTIYYKVPADMYDELARFDGSLQANRTKGTLSARCDKEAFNFLALNLAHEIITGKRTVVAARTFLAQTAAAYPGGPNTAYTLGLLFKPEADGGDPDKIKTTDMRSSTGAVKQMNKKGQK